MPSSPKYHSAGWDALDPIVQDMVIDIRKEWVANGNWHRENGPAIIWHDGDKEWRIYGVRHREDGPAYIGNDYIAWWVDGRLHRIDGPARILHGDKFWYLNGLELMSQRSWFDRLLNCTFPR